MSAERSSHQLTPTESSSLSPVHLRSWNRGHLSGEGIFDSFQPVPLRRHRMKAFIPQEPRQREESFRLKVDRFRSTMASLLPHLFTPISLASVMVYYGTKVGEALFMGALGVLCLTVVCWTMWAVFHVASLVARFVGLE
ncbi:hypothetical protein FA13DRAFT_1325495 [Coprinellus micaceus]|uniref:Uncharacterized protein n=1 Tax=Coprinellus micaceus TaxID=71717 RepID=A0A4Y7SR53_COPMI|nr:hypothetical protein FA13DRAFT_1325495 [Coprinellus micaceus]